MIINTIIDIKYAKYRLIFNFNKKYRNNKKNTHKNPDNPVNKVKLFTFFG